MENFVPWKVGAILSEDWKLRDMRLIRTQWSVDIAVTSGSKFIKSIKKNSVVMIGRKKGIYKLDCQTRNVRSHL